MERAEAVREIKSRLEKIDEEVAALKLLLAELEKEKPVKVEPVVVKPVEPEPKPEPEIEVRKVDGRLISDLRKAIGLNDRIRFQKELFASDQTLMNETIEYLNGVASYDEALKYLSDNFEWDDENETVKYFKDILSRKAY